MENKLLTATQVAAKLNISVVTLSNWYKWFNNDDIEKPKNFPKLPQYIQYGPRTTRYWNSEDVKLLKKFKEWIPKGRNGVMGEVSSSFWGNRKFKIKNSEKTS